MGGEWKAPTLSQLIELIAYCRYKYNESIDCYALISERNGNSILFPLDGYFFPNGNGYGKYHSRIWSVAKDKDTSYCLKFDVSKYNGRVNIIHAPFVGYEESDMLYNIRGIFKYQDVIK